MPLHDGCCVVLCALCFSIYSHERDIQLIVNLCFLGMIELHLYYQCICCKLGQLTHTDAVALHNMDSLLM